MGVPQPPAYPPAHPRALPTLLERDLRRSSPPCGIVHNAIFHISNNIKTFAAARLGAAEIDSPGIKEGLPTIEVFRIASGGHRNVIAAVDCVDGLKIISKEEWSGLDSNSSERIPCTALIANFAEWLVFCREALKVKDDIEMGLLDSRTVLPLVDISASDYTSAAPWVTTRVRYGGFFGYWQTERDLSLEELLQRAKVRTFSGRSANRSAAKRELKQLRKATKETEAELKSKRQATDATAEELEELQERSNALNKMGRFASRKLRALAKRGGLFIHCKLLHDLRFIDSTADSVSRRAYDDSDGKEGWISHRFSIGQLCYWYWCGSCETCKGVYTACKGVTCCTDIAGRGDIPKRTEQELRLVKLMKAEQKRRDKNVKQWIGFVKESARQLNQLMMMIQKSLINSVGYKLDLRSCIGLVKTDLANMCAMQQDGAVALQQAGRGAAVATASTALMEAIKTIKPKLTLETDYSLLRRGKSPIVEFSIDFTFAGVGDDEEDDDDECDDSEAIDPLSSAAGPTARTMAFALLRRSLEPTLEQRGLEWDDVLPILEQMDSVEELQAACDDPEAFLLTLAQASSPAARKLAIASLRPALEPKLAPHGFKWSDVMPVLEAFDTLEELQAAVAEPDSFIQALLTSASGPAAKKMAIARLRRSLEPTLEQRGLEWEDVLPLVEEITDLRELMDASNDPQPFVEKLVLPSKATEQQVERSKARKLTKKSAKLDPALIPAQYKKLYALFFDSDSKLNMVAVLKDVAKEFFVVLKNSVKVRGFSPFSLLHVSTFVT